MENGFNNAKVQWLTYLVYILLVVLTIISGWNTSSIQSIRDTYVPTERYLTDQVRLDTALNRINGKLDRLIERK